MGNTQPKNETGRKVTAQKFENAKKLGVLSLTEHNLYDIPTKMLYEEIDIVHKLRTLDLSHNHLSYVGNIGILSELKSFNIDDNQLYAGSLYDIIKCMKLQNLSLAKNQLGKMRVVKKNKKNMSNKNNNNNHQQQQQQQVVVTTTTMDILPEPLPSSLKQLNISSNFLSVVPPAIVSKTHPLCKLEKLDLSYNQLATVPNEIEILIALQELVLDSNMIVCLPNSVGNLKKLKVLSLRNNHIRLANDHQNTIFNHTTNPQPIPESIFTETSLIDLNLHGNRSLTNTLLNEFHGYQTFLHRRQKVKDKTLTNLDVCGLE